MAIAISGNSWLHRLAMMPSPHHSLAEVKRLVAAGDFDVLRKRALDFLVPPRSYQEAVELVASVIQTLSGRNFVKTVAQQHDLVDVYAATVDGQGWYIKVCIDPGPQAVVISFHPPEHPVRTAAGIVRP